MRKNFLLPIGILLSVCSAYAQSPQWIIGNSLVPFSANGPGTPTNITGLPGNSSSENAAYDQNGDLLFYLRGQKIYNSNNTLSATLPPSYLYSKETVVINVPGTCNQFYVVNLTAFSTCFNCTNEIQYAIVTVNGPAVTLGAIQHLGYGGKGAFAVSKLKADKTRFLFYVGGSVERFIISNTGITHAQTLTTSGDDASDVELYEDASGNMKLAWADNSIGVQIATLNLSGNIVSTYSPTIQGLNAVHGVEFIDYDRLLISTDNTNASQKGIAIVNTNGIPGITYIPNSSAYYNSYIEKAPDGKFYTTKPNIVSGSTQGYTLGVIDYVNAQVTEVPNIVLPSVDIVHSTRLLPDQVDNEDYINTNYKPDLMVRDAVQDIGLEPNLTGDVWTSPDLWNRRDNVGNANENQNPGYGGGGGNLMNVRIKNKGCATSHLSHVKLYWTLGATLERWPQSWDGTTFINTKAAGDEIKTAGLGYADYKTFNGTDLGYEIPVLQPGQDTVVVAKWYPPNPYDYNDSVLITPDAMICFLARIDDANQDPMFNELSSNIASVGHNVKFNNNIATRNSFLTSLAGSYLVVPKGVTVLVGNYLEAPTLFNLRFRGINPEDVEFGTVGKITLKLDEKLWDLWTASGGESEGIEIINEENHEVAVNDMENAVLKNINMEQDDMMAIGCYFSLTTITDQEVTFNFVLSQEKSEPIANEDDYGSECVFNVSVNGNEGSVDDEFGIGASTFSAGHLRKFVDISGSDQVELFPNPNQGISQLKFNMAKQGMVSVKVLDLSGRVVKNIISNLNMSSGLHQIEVSSEGLAKGTYMVQLIAPNIQQTKKMKITK